MSEQWHVGNLSGDDGRTVRSADRAWICQTAIPLQAGTIVRAVNCHDDLTAALERTTSLLRDYIHAAGPADGQDREVLNEAVTALSKAKATP